MPDDDLFDDDTKDFEETNSFNPQQMDPGTFKQRNDPKELLFRFKLQLMNCYTVVTTTKDENNKPVKIIKIKRKKNTKPKANKQGIEDIISYVEKFINSHTVQGNTDSFEQFKDKMRFISNDITMHFIANRKDWGITIKDVDTLISNTINLVDLFLTRTLYNEERKSYGESYKETYHKDVKPQRDENVFQKVGNYLVGR